MKRAILIFLILILAAIGAAPYWFGLKAEETYKALVRELGDDSQVTVINSRYTPGWLSSSAETVVMVAGLPIPIASTHRISHGPFPLSQLTAGKFQLMPVQAAVDSTIVVKTKTQTTLPPIEATTVIELDGTGKSRFTVPAFKGQPGKGVVLEAKGIAGAVKFRANASRVSGFFSAPRIHIAGEDGDLLIKNADVTFDVYDGLSGLSLGDFTFDLERIDLSSKNTAAEPITIQGIGFSTSTKERGGAVNLTLQIKVKQFKIGDATNGPGRLEVRVRNLDAQTLKKFQQQARAMQRQQPAMSPEATGMMAMGGLMAVIAELGERNPELEITKLSFNMADGELLGSGKVVLDGSNKEALGNPMTMLTALNAQGQLTLPESMVRTILEVQVRKELSELRAQGKIPELSAGQTKTITETAVNGRIGNWAAENHFVKDGSKYLIHATYKDGVLALNGLPVDLSPETPPH